MTGVLGRLERSTSPEAIRCVFTGRQPGKSEIDERRSRDEKDSDRAAAPAPEAPRAPGPAHPLRPPPPLL